MADQPPREPERSTKKKINFVERNKALAAAGRKENKNSKENVRPNTATAASQQATKERYVNTEDEKISRRTVTKSATSITQKDIKQKPSRRPVTAPQILRTGVGRNVKRRNDNFSDIVSNMAARNLHHLLSWIFLSLESRDLTACRYVCSDWYKYLKFVFWRDQVVRRQLFLRLSSRWEEKKFTQVCLVVSGHTCKKKCAQNYRDCHCKEKLQCQVSGTRVVVEFGGSLLIGRYEGPPKGGEVVEHRFETDQFQVSLNMKQDLAVESSNWLNTPVFMEKQQERTLSVQEGDLLVERSPSDTLFSTILIKNKKSKEILLRFIPYTGPVPTRYDIEDMRISSGRLAVLMIGRVFVYSISRLLEGANRNALLLSTADERGNAPIHMMHLQESLLLTVAGCRVTTYDFWRFNWDSPLRDFLI